MDQSTKTPAKKRQLVLDKWTNSESTAVTQNMLDEKILNYVIEEVQPFSVVEKGAFIDRILLGLPKNLSIMTRKTLGGRIDKFFTKMTDNILEEFSKQEVISATADLWNKAKRF